MPYSPVKVESFGGLDLERDPADIGWSGAIDILDVDFDVRGLLRTRSLFTALVANTSLTSPTVIGLGGIGFLASTAASVKLYTANGGLTGTAVAPNVYAPGGVQPFGTPGATYIYMANSLTNTVRRLDTSATISAPAGMPTALYLSRSPNDNRLAAGYTVGFPSRVQFSNAGDAETWGANNYVDLDPGDFGNVAAMATYRDLLFVFKEGAYYVFYGTSTDASGNPIFNYRPVRTGVGGYMATTAPDGVYFYGLGPHGFSVFRTNGGEPEDIGRQIRDVLPSGVAPSTFTPGKMTSVGSMTHANGRIYLSLRNAGGNYIFAYNIETSTWTVIQVPSSVMSIATTVSTTYPFPLLVAGTGASAAIHVLDPSNTTTDSLRTPTPLYRSGFSDLGSPDEKRIPMWRLTGVGAPTLKLSTDFGSLETGATVTLGTSPAVDDAPRKYAVKGRNVSWQVSASSAFSLNSLVAEVADKKAAGTRSG